MFSPDQYQLLDFGRGRRLESFGPLRLDRPCPAADRVAPANPGMWESADARFERTEGQQGRWITPSPLPPRWTIRHGPIALELKRTDFGHLGVFPEQAPHWEWIIRQVRAAGGSVRVLNLFAYTGGSTLAAASAGAEVTHVDAAKNVVAWARRNASLSGLADAPIRWICEDARKFVRRELRRGSGYDAVILDPPSYGHGRRGEVWRLSKHLGPLLEAIAQLTDGRLRFLLLTCHTPGFSPRRLEKALASHLPRGSVTARPMTLHTTTDRRLHAGVAARWQWEQGG